MRSVRANFGGFFPSHSAAAKLAVALVAGSLISALLRGSIGAVLLLTPKLVWSRWMFWQPLTYGFIELQPLGVLFGALVIWSLGSALERGWGSKRMLRFAVLVTALAGLLSALLAFVVPALRMMTWAGGTVMSSALWVAYGWSYGRRTTNFWGLPLSGNALAAIGILFVVLTAVMQHWSLVVPEGFALGLTYLYVRYGSPRSLWSRLRSTWERRRLRSRARHLKILSKDRNVGRGSDRFLH